MSTFCINKRLAGRRDFWVTWSLLQWEKDIRKGTALYHEYIILFVPMTRNFSIYALISTQSLASKKSERPNLLGISFIDLLLLYFLSFLHNMNVVLWLLDSRLLFPNGKRWPNGLTCLMTYSSSRTPLYLIHWSISSFPSLRAIYKCIHIIWCEPLTPTLPKTC